MWLPIRIFTILFTASFIYDYFFYLSCIGTLLVNGMTIHVLFDWGDTRSFVSLTLSKKFNDAPMILDYPLDLEIADDRSVSALRVHPGCVLNMFSERYSIHLVLIPL